MFPIPCLLALTALALPSLANPAPFPMWQPRDSPYAKLFQRQSPIPPVGSDAWTNLYPQDTGTPTNIPQGWIDALNQAVAAGLIPNISVTNENNGYPTYADGQGTDPDICSFTYSCNATTDNNNPPDGVIALAFDDGPLPTSDALYDFLASHNQHATHFMIGSNILWNPSQFLHAFTTNQDHIGVHTWSHPYLTTKTNEQLVSELGWTVQIISDSTGGLLPSCYRPPYGDTDNRVRAVAEHVFGLKTVTWNQDSADWSITTGYTTLPAVEASLTTWIEGGKTPGLCILEHELTNDTVDAFIDVYPLMVSSGWTIKPVPDAFGFPWYANALNSTSGAQFTAGVASTYPYSTPSGYGAVAASTPAASASASASASATASASASKVSASAASTAKTSTSPSASPSAKSAASQLAIPLLSLLAAAALAVSL